MALSLSQQMAPVLVFLQLFQTRSTLVVTKVFSWEALKPGIVRKMEHGVEIRPFVKVSIVIFVFLSYAIHLI